MSSGQRFATAAFIILCLWLPWAAMPFIYHLAGWQWKFESLGQWGDSFGVLSSLFTGLGFAGVIATFWIQREQILIQKEQADISERYQHKERFDSTYFELLRLLREIRGEVRFHFGEEYFDASDETDPNESTGHSAMRKAWREAKHYIRNEPGVRKAEEIDKIYYDKVHRRFESGFGPYFRLVYTILRRIDEDKILNFSEKRDYGNLLRSQLSSYELGLIGLNGLCHVSKNLKYYLEEYRLFTHLPPRSSRYRVLINYYDPKAFEGRD